MMAFWKPKPNSPPGKRKKVDPESANAAVSFSIAQPDLYRAVSYLRSLTASATEYVIGVTKSECSIQCAHNGMISDVFVPSPSENKVPEGQRAEFIVSSDLLSFALVVPASICRFHTLDLDISKPTPADEAVHVRFAMLCDRVRFEWWIDWGGLYPDKPRARSGSPFDAAALHEALVSTLPYAGNKNHAAVMQTVQIGSSETDPESVQEDGAVQSYNASSARVFSSPHLLTASPFAISTSYVGGLAGCLRFFSGESTYWTSHDDEIVFEDDFHSCRVPEAEVSGAFPVIERSVSANILADAYDVNTVILQILSQCQPRQDDVKLWFSDGQLWLSCSVNGGEAKASVQLKWLAGDGRSGHVAPKRYAAKDFADLVDWSEGKVKIRMSETLYVDQQKDGVFVMTLLAGRAE